MTKRYQRGKEKSYFRGQKIQWPRDTTEVNVCLPLWYLLVIVFSVLYLRVLFTSLVSTGHCIVWPLIYDFCLPFWYLLVIALSVLWFTTSKEVNRSLYQRTDNTMTKRYQWGKQKSYIRGQTIQWPRDTKEVKRSRISEEFSVLYLRVLFTSLVSTGHCIVCPLIYDFCLPFWYLLVIVLPVLWFSSSVYLFVFP
jgi:hypothetical protein